MEVILAPPVYFDVKDSYNTRMRPDHPCGKPDPKRAFTQWAEMANILSHDLCIRPYFIDPAPDLYDMAFACDPGLWVNDLFVPANFWAKPREQEVGHFVNWFRKNRYTVIYLSHAALFEGGDCVAVKNKVVVGYGENRTNRSGTEELSQILQERGIGVVPIRRVTEEFYHLNSVLTYYPSADLIMYYPKAFKDSAGETLALNFPKTHIVPLSESTLFRVHPDFEGEYLYSYALNAIEQNKKVLQPYCNPAQKEILSAYDLKVIVPKDGSSEFERSGGSYRCLMMMHNIV